MTVPKEASRLRIGLLHQYQLGTSGSGIYLTAVADQLVRLGHEVTVFSHDDQAAARLPPGCATVSLRGAGTPVAYPRAEEPGSPLFRDLSDAELSRYLKHAVALVTETVRARGLDVLHVNSEVPMSFVAAEVGRRCGVPYVVVGHGSTLEYVVRSDARYEPLCRTGLGGAASVVALNRDVRARMLAVAPEIEPRLVQVPPGVACDVFRPAPRPAGASVVTYVGRLSVEKGVFHLLGTLGELRWYVPDIRVLVVGDGVSRPLLEQMYEALCAGDTATAERALRDAAHRDEAAWVDALVAHWAHNPAPESWPQVSFVGHLTPSDVAELVATSDAVVVPSLVREAFPLIVLEALACGTPAVCADQGGLSAVLAELTPQLGELGGRLALPAEANRLTDALAPVVGELLTWLAVGDRRAEAGAACRQVATLRYDWQTVARRLQCLYMAARDRVDVGADGSSLC